MKGPLRYVITRPCLSEGSMRLLKYLEPIFSQEGPLELRDERGQSFSARIDPAARRIWGLHDLYHSHNLGVNDVLVLHELEAGRVQVDCVVKPAERPGTGSSRERLPDPPRRVVVNESAYVREVRLERRPLGKADERPEPSEGTRLVSPAAGSPTGTPPAEAPADKPRSADLRTEARAQPRQTGPVTVAVPEVAAPPVVSAPTLPRSDLPTPEAQLRELAGLTGYTFDRLAPGVLRLRANLAGQGYSVLVALSAQELTSPAWKEPCDYHALLVGERERPQGVPRLTVEALEALIQQAQLTPLTPIELRGYWNTGSFDLESVASLAELVAAQLAQRGLLSQLLMTLAQQPAHSVVSLPRLAERLGSGVSSADLCALLDSLTRPPYSLLSALSSTQYYLRTDVDSALRELTGYAEGLRRRLGARAIAAD